MRALALGAAAVKIFPAGLVGPAYLTDLRGPFPGVPVVPSGGLDAANAADWMRAGALAVTAGSSVVGAALVEAADWATVTARAREFSTVALSA
jgi:2-dehydro-3-deoxyphosphogluconate aldolase/(4S)-4-hydroxy-2-oxoglutarate aldolase